ncbi:MAG: DUF2478 domain-containing protein [Pseudaminobacter sp.]
MADISNIAVIANRDDLNSQDLLSRAAVDWRKAGVRVAGVLAEDNDAEGPCSAGFLRDIASGRRFSIHLDTPPIGTTCHLDSAGLEDACAGLSTQIADADVVLFSKFGKLEAMQKGLWVAFSAAAGANKPLLTTVSSKHIDAWKTFAPTAAWLEADEGSIDQWWHAMQSQALHP